MKRLFCIIIVIIITLPALVWGQTESETSFNPPDQGIRFKHGLNWQQVLVKAKAENKYIFVDCYTTWCVPCKKMEKEVYTDEKVAAAYNDKFISVKMQMDTSEKDNEMVKANYADARYIQSKYRINAYPSYLFFTPDGKLLSRGEGFKEPGEFITLANDATDPEKNYYTVLAKFKEGRTNLHEASWLALKALLLGDTTASNEIARTYILHLNKDSLFTNSAIQFMAEFTKRSSDPGFQFFYKNVDSINRIIEDDTFVQQLVQRIIYREIVLPEVAKVEGSGNKPSWENIKTTIEKKYNKYYAERVTIAARCSYALKHNDNKEYTKYLVQFQEKFGSRNNTGLMPSLILNNYAWEIFKSSNNTYELEKALEWSGRAVLMYPSSNWMDTYANILYKLGRTEDAIGWEQVAAKLSPNSKEILLTLEKMKKGEPTWSRQ